MSEPLDSHLQAMLQAQALPQAYLESALKWFAPLADAIAAHHNGAKRPLLVGINGSQGSGKTTACEYLRLRLQHQHGCSVAVMSLDDFYLTRENRRHLARSVHPLLQTRGVPGTHDLPLLQQVLDALLAGEQPAIPRFDKARDDRCPDSSWQAPATAVDIVLLEGWCMGVPPQPQTDLQAPVNDLEASEDPDGAWRGYVNSALERDYLPLYARVDYWAMLQAPSFDCVFRWRLEQERKLAARIARERGDDSAVMSEAAVARFIQFYQRLTEHGLATLPGRVHCTLALDEERRIHGVQWQAEAQLGYR